MSSPTETSFTPARRGWLSDFGWSDGRIHVHKTGVRLALDRHLIAEVADWIVYLLILALVATLARLTRPRRTAIWFSPEQPRPWYLIRGAALWAGIAVSRTVEGADAAFYFDDVTVGEPTPPHHANRFNYRCLDISKSHVAAVFESVFGYALTVDPDVFQGPMVEKSEKNGVHDGRIVAGPRVAAPGHVYQRLVDTCDPRGHAQDLRTLCAGGAPVLVWVKTKPAGRRFAIHNREARLQRPEEVFTAAEMALIGAFAARIGLDWGGLDILRDRKDGRIYIVDVNKTDVGPVIALSWRDKIRSMRCLAAALDRLMVPAMAPKSTSAWPRPALNPVGC